jgi:hypothetical protein
MAEAMYATIMRVDDVHPEELAGYDLIGPGVRHLRRITSSDLVHLDRKNA